MPQEIIEKYKKGENPILISKELMCNCGEFIGGRIKKGYGFVYHGVPVLVDCRCVNNRVHTCEEYNSVGDSLCNQKVKPKSKEIKCFRCNDNGCPACDGTKGDPHNPDGY